MIASQMMIRTLAPMVTQGVDGLPATPATAIAMPRTTAMSPKKNPVAASRHVREIPISA